MFIMVTIYSIQESFSPLWGPITLEALMDRQRASRIIQKTASKIYFLRGIRRIDEQPCFEVQKD